MGFSVDSRPTSSRKLEVATAGRLDPLMLRRWIMVARKHHYVPKCYLKSWTGADGLLCEYRRPHEMVVARRKHPSETGWIDKLYTVDSLQGGRSDAIETEFFLRVDQGASNALDLLLNNRTDLNAEQHSDWTRFLMSLLHRHPAKIAELWKAALDRFQADMDGFSDLYEARRKPTDPATFEEFKALEGDKLVGGIFAGAIRRICNSQRIGTHINGMMSHVITLESNNRFLTSDRPLLLTGGLEDPDTALLMPIAPRKLFVATNGPHMSKALHDGLASGVVLHNINLSVVRQAYRYVYAICENDLPFVEANLGRDLPLPWEAPVGSPAAD